MNSGQGDVFDAIRTLVLGPFVALAVGVLFYVAARIYWVLRPMGTSGPFADAYNTLGTSLSISYGLFQLASSIGTLFAVAVIGLAAYNFFNSFGGGRRGR
jgi:hypothetical protein